ncbi:MAG: hypothetical protein BECKG1743F_GA0114225_111861 [Candidatus Kentron sp. G]|nr:MAG: hypothetical protein BECKG1743F_GA0114225_111861 [Candidatus Kentron sp. G]
MSLCCIAVSELRRSCTSTDVYAYIEKNLAAWIEEAISIRKKH